MKKKHVFKLIWFVIYGIFFIIVGQDPFFGDAISGNSRAAWNIYDSGFSVFLFPEGYDPGHPVLIPFLNAICWKIFTPSLWLSHAINFFFAIGILHLTFKLTLNWFNEKTAFWSVSLLGITPLFMAQTAMMNAHLPLAFFVLLLIYYTERKQLTGLNLAASGMLLTHLQSIYFLIPIALFYLNRARKNGQLRLEFLFWLKALILPLIVFVIWVSYHYAQTGWALSSPDYATHRGFPGIKRVLINLVLSDWRIVDFGLMAAVVPLFIFLIRKPTQKLDKSVSIFIWLFLFNAIAISFTTGTGPAHRYFLPCIPFLIIWFAHYLSKSSNLKKIVLVGILISGHFWFYPGKIIGDGTLAYRNVFPLLEQFHIDYQEKEAYSYAPIGNPTKWTYLNPIHPDTKSLYKNNLSQVDLVLASNVSGDFKKEDFQILDEQFNFHSYEKGYIYLNVYVRKKSSIDLADTFRRKPSASELWMQNLKHKIKGDSGM